MRGVITIILILFSLCHHRLLADDNARWYWINQENSPYEFNAVRYGMGHANSYKNRTYFSMYGEHHWRNFFVMDYFIPLVGIAMDAPQNLFFYGGVRIEAHRQQFSFGASFAPTLYKHGRKKNLGSRLQFRSALDLSYEFTNKTQLGLELAHYSNGGLAKTNPGLETLSLIYTVPY